MVTSIVTRFLGALWIITGVVIAGLAAAYMLISERAVSTAAQVLGGGAPIIDFISQRLGGSSYLNWWGLGLAVFLILLGARLLALAPIARPVAMAFHLLAGLFVLFIALAAFLALNRAGGVVGVVVGDVGNIIILVIALIGILLLMSGFGLGTRAAADAFTPSGGSLLVAASPAPTVSAPVAGPTARLVNLSSAAVYTLRPNMGVIGIGRDAAQAIVLDESSVSDQHAQIEYRQGAFMLSNLSNTNGTWVNGQRLKVIDHALQTNDEIAFGRVKLRFEL